MQLSPNFSLEELTYSDTANAYGIDNTPPDDVVPNLARLSQVLEQIRALCDGCTVVINSGYRCEELNEEVGGVPDSAHRYGLAADIVIPEFGSATVICDRIRPHIKTLQIDQLIDEAGGTWTHVGLSAGDPRCECFEL